jgi:hypothetical protein
LREVNAVTVGIGFQCPDGVVLCADRQITKEDGLKYEEQKVFVGHHRGGIAVDCACVYAHNPDLARNIFEDFFKSIRGAFAKVKEKDIFLIDAIQQTLEEVLKSRKGKDMEFLIAFRAEQIGISPFLMCARGLTVARSQREYIGVGDSSVLRYTGELLERTHLSVEQAKAAGIYMVSLANRFIDRCGGTDVLAMPKGGEVELLSQERIDEYKTVLSKIDKTLATSLVGELTG